MRAIALAFLTSLTLSSARAAFHLWTIQEVYSDNSGSLQFIELYTPETQQNFVNGQLVRVTKGTQSHSLTVPGAALPGDTTGHTLLFGTAGLQAAGGPTPDYIIPDNFLFAGSGNLNFFNAVFGSYAALPTDGAHSLNYPAGTSALNSPANYSGQTGFITVTPEPTTAVLLGFGALGSLVIRRRIKG